MSSPRAKRLRALMSLPLLAIYSCRQVSKPFKNLHSNQLAYRLFSFLTKGEKKAFQNTWKDC
jgi:hypothetical protein